jgi:hypothetical protein
MFRKYLFINTDLNIIFILRHNPFNKFINLIWDATNISIQQIFLLDLKPHVEFFRTFPCENTVETSEKESFLEAEFSAHPQDAEDTPLQPLAYRQARQ